MSRRKLPPHHPPRDAAPALDILQPDAAAIDVHSDLHVACVPAGRDPDGNVRQFRAYTADLLELADWLARCRIRTVAIESTGVYWIALFELLEARGFEVCLIEPGQAKRCGARPKTDRLDAQWLQRLHACGLLRASFRPPDQVIALRAYLRQRQMLVRYAAAHVQHIQKALEQMNLKLPEVLSDVVGVTGQRILDAILAGERDPATLARLRDRHCKHDEAAIARALTGTWREEHLFELRQALELFRYYQAKISECDAHIRDRLGRLPDRSDGQPRGPKPRQRGRKRNDLRFEACDPLFRALGLDLTAIEGIDVGTALVVLAEIGVDVSRFPTEKHFAAWLGLCPLHDRSNKTDKARRVRRGKNRLAIALRLAAQTVHKSPSALGSFFRRMRGRLGPAGAVTATAHKLARLIYRMLCYGTEYVTQSLAEYEAKMRDRQERLLRKKARQLGFELIPQTAPA